MTRRPGEGTVLALACAGSFVVILDATIVSVALPAIRFGLGFSSGALAWVVNAYTLAFAGFLLLGGRLCDEFGVRRMFVLGMSLFTVARLAAGLAGSPETLLVARTVQGFGGALLMPVTLSLLTTMFTEPARRARALGTWSAVGAAGAAAGPVIGGLLTQWAGWRWVFFVSVPIGVVAVLAAGAVLPLRDRSRPRGRLDVVGAVLSTAGLVGVVYAVMRSSADGWVLPMVGGLVLLGVFLVHQHRWANEPLVALGIFRLRSVSSGNVVIFLLGLGFLASPILLSLYLQDVHGYSPLQAGLAYLPVGVAMFAGARTAGGLSVRLGPRRATALYCAIGAAGFAGVAALTGAHASYVVSVLLPGMVFGFGTAAAFTPITVAATSGVPERQNGLAAGLLNTVRQTSGAIGLAALTALAAAVTAAWQTGSPRDEALVHGYTAAFLASAACLAAAAVVAAVTMPGLSSRPRGRAGGPGRGTRGSPPGSPLDDR
ncbi:DHA2 family efflux MFS transporter permease subunit [Amycolatopsis sp. lyj-84]|uniref:DHA2 family efflux MFS transporter permease subunit n=1 Tax=Amycolatopsis sp. lyj-84 TaxID=2789284 RepID=UPI003978C346